MREQKRLGHGEGYTYAHDAPDAVAKQDYLGVERHYYQPTSRGLERDLGERLAEIRRRLKESHQAPANRSVSEVRGQDPA